MTGSDPEPLEQRVDLGGRHLGRGGVGADLGERAAEQLQPPLRLDLTAPAHGGVLLGDAQQLEPDALDLEGSGEQLGAELARGALAAQDRLHLRRPLAHELQHQLAEKLDDLVGVVGGAGRDRVGRLGQLGRRGERLQCHVAHTTRSRSGFPAKKS